MCEEKNATKRNVNIETLPKCESSPSETPCVAPEMNKNIYLSNFEYFGSVIAK